ncbi:MAG: class I SAM-dependent methyltransferase [Gammaproteobacteria bacterium]
MDSKEFGLVAAQQLFQIQDLHYGFWEEGEIPSIKNFLEAQNKHTLFLFKYIEEAINADKKCKLLDIGCGIGITTAKLLEMGYRVDGLVPSSWMAKQARKNTQQYKDKTRGEIYECSFEDFPTSHLSEKYTLAFFSESFQYVNMQKAFDILNLILSKAGTVIIFDFFARDEVTGESPLGGGHSIGQFYETVKRNGYTIHTDLDVTENLSPNLTLVNDILVNRVIPFSNTLDAFLSTRFKLLYKLLKYMFRRKLEKIKYKYSQSRNEENFRKFKTYRLFVLKRT